MILLEINDTTICTCTGRTVILGSDRCLLWKRILLYCALVGFQLVISETVFACNVILFQDVKLVLQKAYFETDILPHFSTKAIDVLG